MKNFLTPLAAATLLLSVSAADAALVAHWAFDEAGGPTAFDSVGGNHGALAGGAAFAPGGGIFGGAINLNAATGDLVNMGNIFPFTSGSFSLQAWIKVEAGTTAALIPVAKHQGGFFNGYFLAVNDVGDGLGGAAVNKAHFYDSGPNSGASTTVVNDGEWHQLVGVYNTGAGRAEIHVDGNLESFAALVPIIANPAAFLVGGVLVGSNPAPNFTGLIDDVRVYDHALDETEVRALFAPPIPVPEPATLTLFGLALLVLGLALRQAGKPV